MERYKIKKINIQFFATLHENIEFIKNAIESNFHAILFVNGYKKSIIINKENINSIKDFLSCENSNFWQSQVIFSCEEFVYTSDYNEFYKQNLNILFFTIGEQNNDILKESWLASSIFLHDISASLKFNILAKIIKQNTLCGASLVINGLMKKFDRNIRYTKEAYNFNKKGGKVFQVNEKIHFILGKQ